MTISRASVDERHSSKTVGPCGLPNQPQPLFFSVGLQVSWMVKHSLSTLVPAKASSCHTKVYSSISQKTMPVSSSCRCPPWGILHRFLVTGSSIAQGLLGKLLHFCHVGCHFIFARTQGVTSHLRP